jgi:steroid delta-isomerase-like uncharacterized protein
MPANQNKAIVRRLWEEVWNQKKLAVCDEIFDETYATHEKGWATYVFGVIPDIRFEVEDMIAEEDKVVTRLTISGAHQGEFLGAPGTGKTFSVTGMWIHRLENSRIVEGQDWGQWDALGFLQQVGAAPTPSS